MEKNIFNKLAGLADDFLALLFPRNITIEEVGSEVLEHFEIIKFIIKRFFLPFAVIYIIAGFVLGIHVLGSLFLGLIIFLYSNFLPDMDSVFKKLNISEGSKLYKGYVKISKKGRMLIRKDETKWYEKYAVLFFAPLFIYYILFQKAKHLYTTQEKPFHNIRSLFAYSSFLLLLGIILYSNILEQISISVFGGVGYYTHLFIDNVFKQG